MSDLYWLTDEQMAQLAAVFPQEPRQALKWIIDAC